MQGTTRRTNKLFWKLFVAGSLVEIHAPDVTLPVNKPRLSLRQGQFYVNWANISTGTISLPLLVCAKTKLLLLLSLLFLVSFCFVFLLLLAFYVCLPVCFCFFVFFFFISLRTVPTFVTAHTFCASRDTRVSYGWCLLIQGYLFAV